MSQNAELRRIGDKEARYDTSQNQSTILNFFSKRAYGTVLPPISTLYARSLVATCATFVLLAGQRLLRFDARTRELVALAASSANGCTFCFDLHGFDGRKVITIAELESIANGDLSKFAKQETALLTATRGWCRGERSPALFANLEPHYTDRQIARLVWLVASHVFLNFLGTTLQFPSQQLSKVQLR